MKILYGINGTGRGHVMRSKAVIPLLRQNHEVDILVSGQANSLGLGEQPRFEREGFTFHYIGETVSYLKMAAMNDLGQFIMDVHRLNLVDYDLVVSDFEPVTAWAARKRGVPCVNYSHQAAFLSRNCPRPNIRSLLGEFVMANYAPADRHLGSHYLRYDDNIMPPVLRKSILDLESAEGDHITVYLAKRDPQKIVKKLLKAAPDRTFEVFTPLTDNIWNRGKVSVYPTDNERFLRSLRTSWGVITNAGFCLPSEAMYLKKRMLVIPQKRQYEQACNAAALHKMGCWTSSKLKSYTVADWVRQSNPTCLPEVATAEEVVANILKEV